MTYHFRPESLPNVEMQRIAREQIAAALDASLQLDTDEATHQIRKHCKKMRALVRLVQKTNGEAESLYRFENTHYRRIADLLSGSRDAVSLHDALRKQLGDERFPATAALLKSRIDTSGAQEALQQARDLLRQGAQHVDTWDLTGLDRKDLMRGYARSYRRTFKAMEKALPDDDDGRMHTLRKRVKDQWYHTRLLQPLKPKKIGRRRARLKTLASALGDWRDLRLLCAFLASHKQVLSAEAEEELIPLLDAAQQRLAELREVIGCECELLFRHKRWKQQRLCKVPAPD
ncbi:CHAD domain-containing protein [Microbulbifer sp. SH-1]|uniref:CHAD domain-containing protein n=1 Tax=Microbulbifer sp. SH-1 TaxID=2681547 RepID=UPI001408F6DE|nr:CHAD domain-containing protein [Microbulbifer sp. SH-1]QIL90855.1 CHAD domain-containing protein [Microbulbifer sp. SH-1]